MNLIRKLLFAILGKDLYFRVVSKCFLLLYRTGLLAGTGKFRTHYLVRRLLHQGDTIIDIGANLGYYTSIFSRAAGTSGKVYAVEPIPHYRKILISNTRKYSNIEIIPFALTNKEGETEMGIPSDQKYRHGLTRILDKNDHFKNSQSFKVLTKTPESLFGNLDKLEYIKCDIEGHEDKVLPGFRSIIEKHEPVIQIEIEKRNFDFIESLLTNLGYNSYIVTGNNLIPLEHGESYSSDIIFIHKNRKRDFSNIIK